MTVVPSLAPLDKHLDPTLCKVLRELCLSTELRPPDAREVQLLKLLEQVGPRPDGAISVGADGAVSFKPLQRFPAEQRLTIEESLSLLAPWRKGPFILDDIFIDSEWRSDLKWNRLMQCLPNLGGKSILDVGSGNGYYLYRLLLEGAAIAVGFDPSAHYRLQFEFLQYFFQMDRTAVLPLGFEEAASLPPVFDVVLCLGLVYHHPEPVSVIRKCAVPGRSSSLVIVESLVLPPGSVDPLVAPTRYLNMRNLSVIPTAELLVKWCGDAGLVDCELHSIEPLTPEEQRSTPFARGRSLSDFLTSGEPLRTVEGHPRPFRAIVSGRKR